MTCVLFVDNDAASLVLFRELCRLMGIECECVEKPAQLTAVIQKRPHFDLALVDLEMPQLTGYEVLKLLRSLPQFQTTPIVACTVYVGEFDQAYRAGFNSFITKPINIDRFPEQIMALVAGQTIWERYSG